MEINATNFPDSAFRIVVARFDTNNDKTLTTAEISAVTKITMTGSRVKDLTGIEYFTNVTSLIADDNELTSLKEIEGLTKLTELRIARNNLTDISVVKTFTELQTLDIAGNDLTAIDLSGMNKLSDVTYNENKNLKTVDLRNSPSLKRAYQAINGETIQVSPGTTYIGSVQEPAHSGNLVMDLNGFYTVNQDGSKTVDLTKVLSTELIAVFEENEQPNYDTATKTLTIPANTTSSVFKAGRTSTNVATEWTFTTAAADTEQVTVTFNTNGGSSIAPQTIAKDGTVSAPTSPTRAGYTFDGWYADQALTKEWNFTTDKISENTTLYPKWTEGAATTEFTVTFNSNGGSAVSSQTVTAESLATTPTVPTREGYVFAGWYSDAALSTAFSFTTPVTGNMTLYAKWDVNQNPDQTSFTVTFETNGGPTVASQTVARNNLATAPTGLTRSGYVFAGWYADQALTTMWDFSTPITANMTLYAKWNVGNTVPNTTTSTSSSSTNTGGKKLPQTGEAHSSMSLFGYLALAIGALLFIVKKKNNAK